jgi:hypothetical protein
VDVVYPSLGLKQLMHEADNSSLFFAEFTESAVVTVLAVCVVMVYTGTALLFTESAVVTVLPVCVVMVYTGTALLFTILLQE